MKEKFSSEIDKTAIEWLKYHENKNHSKREMMKSLTADPQDSDLADWLNDENEEKMMRVVLSGEYEVEIEYFYVYEPTTHQYLGRYADNSGMSVKYGWFIPFEEPQLKLTLAEIEAINPDYLAFKEKVE